MLARDLEHAETSGGGGGGGGGGGDGPAGGAVSASDDAGDGSERKEEAPAAGKAAKQGKKRKAPSKKASITLKRSNRNSGRAYVCHKKQGRSDLAVTAKTAFTPCRHYGCCINMRSSSSSSSSSSSIFCRPFDDGEADAKTAAARESACASACRAALVRFLHLCTAAAAHHVEHEGGGAITSLLSPSSASSESAAFLSAARGAYMASGRPSPSSLDALFSHNGPCANSSAAATV